jgi:hypothetical protein
MIKVFDYISFRQPEIVECIMRIGLLAGSFRVVEQSEFTAEQEYISRLMRQRPARPGVVFYRY